MSAVRRIMRIICLIGLAVFALAAMIVAVSLPHEIKRNITLAHSFASAASWIDEFVDSNGRLPSESEYEAWAASQPKDFYGVQSIHILSPSSFGFYREAIDALGPPPSSSRSYVLARWMGEWNEYYASWAGKSTLNNSPEFYGAVIALGAFFLLAACGCGYLAFFRLRPTSAPKAM